MKASVALTCLALGFTTLASAPAWAQTQEEQQACVDDAFNVCGHAIPDRTRVAACLTQNISRISSACRTVMLRYSKSTPGHSGVQPSSARRRPLDER
jgi:hypothetical protein